MPVGKKVVPRKARAKKPLFQKLALVFDTETTGLIKNRSIPLHQQPEIVEFYGCIVDLNTGKIISEFERMFKPSRPMRDDVIKIHGITNEFVADCEAFTLDAANELRAFIESAPCVIAHNLSFDVDMVELEMDRHVIPIKWPRKLCTVEQTYHVHGYRLNLNALHKWLFDEPFKGAHRARADVMALVRCCMELNKRGLI